MRAVFEDSQIYRHGVREIQILRDRGVLGSAHHPGSIVIESVASHFELISPDRVVPQLEVLVADLTANSPPRGSTQP